MCTPRRRVFNWPSDFNCSSGTRDYTLAHIYVYVREEERELLFKMNYGTSERERSLREWAQREGAAEREKEVLKSDLGPRGRARCGSGSS